MWPFKKPDKEIINQAVADKINQLDIEMGPRGRVVYKGSGVMNKTECLPDFYLEQIEKGLRHDLRFRDLITKDSQTTIWNLLVMLEKNGLYTSYLLGEMDYKYD